MRHFFNFLLAYPRLWFYSKWYTPFCFLNFKIQCWFVLCCIYFLLSFIVSTRFHFTEFFHINCIFFKFSSLLSFGVTLMRIFLYSEKLYRSQRVIIISHYNSLFSLPLTTFKRTILKHPKSELLKLISMFPCYMELQKTTESLYPFQFTPFKFLQWRCTDAFCNMRHIL